MSTVSRVDLAAELRDRGYRMTRQRRAVWDVLRRAPGHLTVEEIASRLAHQGDDVDLASIYRTLDLFSELGIARPSRLGDSDASRWEVAHPDEHFHLVCLQCGDVDHHVGNLVSTIESHLDRGHGFQAYQVELTVEGRCARCRRLSGELPR